MRVFCAERGSGLGPGQGVRKPREMKIPNVVLAPARVWSGKGREGKGGVHTVDLGRWTHTLRGPHWGLQPCTHCPGPQTSEGPWIRPTPMTQNGCYGRHFMASIRFSECMQCTGFPGGDSGIAPACQRRRLNRHGLDPWVRKIPWRRAWQPTPVFLPGESHGQRSLAGYSTWGHRESDTTEATEHTHTHVV